MKNHVPYITNGPRHKNEGHVILSIFFHQKECQISNDNGPV